MTRPHPLYTPEDLTLADLDAATVGDTTVAGRVTERIHLAARTGTRAHTLLLAPWGAGKTHTLALAARHALADPATRGGVRLAWIGQDNARVASYPDLLAEALRQVRPGQLPGDPDDREGQLLAGLGGAVLVLVLDRLEALFHRIGAAGARALRGFVETSGTVLVLAAADALFPAVSSRTEPWFGNFDIERLPSLTAGDYAELLARRAAHGQTAPSRRATSPPGTTLAEDTLRRIGSAPRLWQIIATTCPHALPLPDEAEAVVLDALAPRYRALLDNLPTVERLLLAELARADAPLPVGEAAQAAGVSAAVAVVAARRLATAGTVVGAKQAGTDQRLTYYRLTDPLLATYLRQRLRAPRL